MVLPYAHRLPQRGFGKRERQGWTEREAMRSGFAMNRTLGGLFRRLARRLMFPLGLMAAALRGHIRLRRIVSLKAVPAECRLHLPARPYTRVDPRVFDQNDYIRQFEAKCHRKTVHSPEAWVYTLREAQLVHGGLILTSGGDIVSESLINRHDFRRIAGTFRISGDRALSCETIRPDQVVRGGEAVLLSQPWDENYGHWLIETLPRLLMVERIQDISRLKIIVFAKKKAIDEVYARSLFWLGVPEDKIVWVNSAAFVERLIYPTPLTIQPWIKSEICVETLERIARSVMGAQPSTLKKIYISRNADSSDRKLRDEDDIIGIVEKQGYTVVHCGQHDFDEQVRLFSAATHIVGNLGAGFVNMGFAPRGVRILALTSPLMPDDFFYDLASLKQGHYWSIHGQGCGVRADYRDDFTIDPARFASIFAAFEVDETASTALAS